MDVTYPRLLKRNFKNHPIRQKENLRTRVDKLNHRNLIELHLSLENASQIPNNKYFDPKAFSNPRVYILAIELVNL